MSEFSVPWSFIEMKVIVPKVVFSPSDRWHLFRQTGGILSVRSVVFSSSDRWYSLRHTGGIFRVKNGGIFRPKLHRKNDRKNDRNLHRKITGNLTSMQTLQLSEEELNEILRRAKQWSVTAFRAKITPEDVQSLESLGFDFGPGVRTFREKKDSFTRWVRENPLLQFPSPSDVVEAIRKSRE